MPGISFAMNAHTLVEKKTNKLNAVKGNISQLFTKSTKIINEK